eukprot:scaffold885_cov381-Prasinococcus_capsulatus_cf.AAC.2
MHRYITYQPTKATTAPGYSTNTAVPATMLRVPPPAIREAQPCVTPGTARMISSNSTLGNTRKSGISVWGRNTVISTTPRTCRTAPATKTSACARPTTHPFTQTYWASRSKTDPDGGQSAYHPEEDSCEPAPAVSACCSDQALHVALNIVLLALGRHQAGHSIAT